MKRYTIIAVLACLLISGYSQEKDYSNAFHLIEIWLEAQKDYEQLPGLSASVINDQDVLWSGAFGYANMETKRKSTSSTLYSICSISKLFTSVAIMKLYEEGLLRLDDHVSELLPWYDLEQQFEDSWPITVRALLTHSSGLPREANFPYWTGPDFPFPSQDAIRAELKNQETLYPSSTYFQYSNLGLTLLGEIIEEVSGMEYDDFIQQNILDPLGLTDTHTELPEQLYGTDLAKGYSALTRSLKRDHVDLFQADGIKPAAGFSSNVLDLGKFSSWQFRLMDSTLTEILKPSTLKYMQNVHWTDPDGELTWGLGFSVSEGSDGEKWVGHGGSCPGYRSSLVLIPDSKRAYSVMVNAGGTSPSKYVSGIHEILKKVKDPAKKDPSDDAEAESDLSEYQGYFSLLPWGSELYVTPWYGKLVMLRLPVDAPEDAMALFRHVEGDTFRRERDDGQLGETVVFERDENGQVIHFIQHGNFTRKKLQ